MKVMLNDEQMYHFYDMLASNQYDNDVAALQEALKYLPAADRDNAAIDVNASQNFARLLRNLKRVYSEKEAMEQVCVIDNVQRIFRERIKINGLERLLATSFLDIEWSMFLEYDFDNERELYYRDHFFHQLRDAYFSFVLLSMPTIQNALWNWYSDQDSIIAQYIKRSQAELNKQKLTINEFLCMIYKTLFIASVFHDLGYPLSHYSRVSHQISESLSFHNFIFQTSKCDFQQVHSLLASSLLFHNIPVSVIAQKYAHNDHGALSAFCLLLDIYQSGEAYDMPKDHLCMVNLAAQAIFDHTDKFSANERMIFSKNPISYLLRVCDDLQEWSRFSTILESNRNALVTCTSLDDIFTDDGRKYRTLSENPLFYKVTRIQYKKLNVVYLCSNLSLEVAKDIINVNIDYDLLAQLEVATMNFASATHRKNELDGVRRMLSQQKYLPSFQLHYFLSNNVFALAKEIIKQYRRSIGINPLKDKSLETLIENKVTEIEQIISQIDADYKDSELLYFYPDLKESEISKTSQSVSSVLKVQQYSEYLQVSSDFLHKHFGLLGLLCTAPEWRDGKSIFDCHP